MTVKEFIEQVKLAKNKDSKVVFKFEGKILELDLMAEVIETNGTVAYPKLGETTNAVVVKLSKTAIAAKDSTVEPTQLTILGNE